MPSISPLSMAAKQKRPFALSPTREKTPSLLLFVCFLSTFTFSNCISHSVEVHTRQSPRTALALQQYLCRTSTSTHQPGSHNKYRRQNYFTLTPR
uniref:Putative secreted protein n=1 Tax=Rhipicephalus microplus TaxID=6941 RepID=A0A6G5A222_RHIMP